jgi:hypothetical protein
MHNMLDAGRANRHGNQSSYWHHEPFNRDDLLSSIAVVDRAADGVLGIVNLAEAMKNRK